MDQRGTAKTRSKTKKKVEENKEMSDDSLRTVTDILDEHVGAKELSSDELEPLAEVRTSLITGTEEELIGVESKTVEDASLVRELLTKVNTLTTTQSQMATQLQQIQEANAKQFQQLQEVNLQVMTLVMNLVQGQQASNERLEEGATGLAGLRASVLEMEGDIMALTKGSKATEKLIHKLSESQKDLRGSMKTEIESEMNALERKVIDTLELKATEERDDKSVASSAAEFDVIRTNMESLARQFDSESEAIARTSVGLADSKDRMDLFEKQFAAFQKSYELMERTVKKNELAKENARLVKLMVTRIDQLEAIIEADSRNKTRGGDTEAEVATVGASGMLDELESIGETPTIIGDAKPKWHGVDSTEEERRSRAKIKGVIDQGIMDNRGPLYTWAPTKEPYNGKFAEPAKDSATKYDDFNYWLVLLAGYLTPNVTPTFPSLKEVLEYRGLESGVERTDAIVGTYFRRHLWTLVTRNLPSTTMQTLMLEVNDDPLLLLNKFAQRYKQKTQLENKTTLYMNLMWPLDTFFLNTTKKAATILDYYDFLEDNYTKLKNLDPGNATSEHEMCIRLRENHKMPDGTTPLRGYEVLLAEITSAESHMSDKSDETPLSKYSEDYTALLRRFKNLATQLLTPTNIKRYSHLTKAGYKGYEKRGGSSGGTAGGHKKGAGGEHKDHHAPAPYKGCFTCPSPDKHTCRIPADIQCNKCSRAGHVASKCSRMTHQQKVDREKLVTKTSEGEGGSSKGSKDYKPSGRDFKRDSKEGKASNGSNSTYVAEGTVTAEDISWIRQFRKSMMATSADEAGDKSYIVFDSEAFVYVSTRSMPIEVDALARQVYLDSCSAYSICGKSSKPTNVRKLATPIAVKGVNQGTTPITEVGDVTREIRDVDGTVRVLHLRDVKIIPNFPGILIALSEMEKTFKVTEEFATVQHREENYAFPVRRVGKLTTIITEPWSASTVEDYDM